MKPECVLFEIPVHDLARAVRFYEALFQTRLETCDCGEEQMAFFEGKKGMLSKAPGFTPSADGPIVYFRPAEPLAAVVQRATAAGATIVRDVTRIDGEGNGLFALLKDSEGNRIGLHGHS